MQESGYLGTLVSLGGVKGSPGRGRQLVVRTAILGIGDPFVQIMDANPLRVSAILENNGISNVILGIGEGATHLVLNSPGDTLQIDSNFPWTGSVWAQSGGASSVQIVEISVP